MDEQVTHATEHADLKRGIGPWLLFFFVLGDIVGAGIYALVGEVGAVIGGAIWVAFLCAFILAIFTAASYAELVTKYPRAGGSATYVNNAFQNPFVSFMVAFAVAATVLSSTFDWPDILREPPDVVLPAFVDGGTSLVWTWFAVAWTYAILLVPILLLPAALGRRDDPVLRAATFVGAASVLLSLIGFLRWVFVVPALAESYVAGDATTKSAVAAAWMAQHQFGGALLGEHLGQLLAIGWSITVSIVILRTGILWRWVGWAGLVASVLYLFNQGDILATAVPGFPVFDLAGFAGSSLWAIWLIALGVAVLRAPIRRPTAAAAAAPSHA